MVPLTTTTGRCFEPNIQLTTMTPLTTARELIPGTPLTTARELKPTTGLTTALSVTSVQQSYRYNNSTSDQLSL